MKSIRLQFFTVCLATLVSAQPAITVYNENFGVVRDTVSLDLNAGLSDVSYSGVTAQLEPESVILRDPSGAVALSVVEQSYRGDPVDQQRLLQMFEGQSIRFLKVVDGKEVIESGKIIRAPSMITTKNQYGNPQQKHLEPIIQVDGELQTRLPGVPLFPSLGDDSVLQPTLSWKLHSDKKAAFDAQLSYLTNGMSWKSDYNLVLPKNQSKHNTHQHNTTNPTKTGTPRRQLRHGRITRHHRQNRHRPPLRTNQPNPPRLRPQGH